MDHTYVLDLINDHDYVSNAVNYAVARSIYIADGEHFSFLEQKSVFVSVVLRP
jgi:hypothetical protein